MFSIAAINDTSSHPRLGTLPPTKEAQEARLAQTYQEALTELQGGNLPKAQTLFKSILQDPIILQTRTSKKENAADSIDSNPMLQLRFSTLKNLAETLYKQDSNYHNDALECYLQAASIDQDDVVLWNRLGTLACALGHLNIARAAFEQGLICSPRNWLCMEKLAEVLIAIGDEEACCYIVKRLLRISPSHTRARHIDDVLEGRADAREILRRREYFNDCLYKLNVLPRGLDLLEPQHFSLCFPKKRHLEDEDEDEDQGRAKRSKIQTLEVRLPELSWRAMVLSMLDQLQASAGLKAAKTSDPKSEDPLSSCSGRFNPSQASLVNALVIFAIIRKRISTKEVSPGNGSPQTLLEDSSGIEIHGSCQSTMNGLKSSDELRNGILLKVPAVVSDVPSAKAVSGASFQEGQNTKEGSSQDANMPVEQSPTNQQDLGVLTDALKVVEAYEDDIPSQERRSTRSERIRTRRYDKDEEAFLVKDKNQDPGEVLKQLLEPFISCTDRDANEILSDCKTSRDVLVVDVSKDNSDEAGRNTTEELCAQDLRTQEEQVIDEERKVLQFIDEHKFNSGPYHIAHKLLEGFAAMRSRDRIPTSKVLMLEKLTRQFSWTTRSGQCSLFLAELCLDAFIKSSNENCAAEFLSECDFHLCRVVETAAIHAGFKVMEANAEVATEATMKVSSIEGGPPQEATSAKKDVDMRDAVDWSDVIRVHHTNLSQSESINSVETHTRNNIEIINKSQENDWSLWARYHWLNGRWQTCSGNQERAHEELCICLQILERRRLMGDTSVSILLPHCNVDNAITSMKVQRKLYELDIDKLLKQSAADMVERAQHSELIELLVPVLLPSKDTEKGKLGWNETRRGVVDLSPEFTGLSMLISACEKVTPANFGLALQCHARRLKILCDAMGMGSVRGLGSSSNLEGLDQSPSNSDSEQEQGKGTLAHSKLVIEEVKLVSRCAASIRDRVGESGGTGSVVHRSLLGQIQLLLLNIMCYYIKSYDAGESAGPNSPSSPPELDTSSFVDTFVAFCRLQHLDASTSPKQQVALLATVHDVLATRGLCCAGKSCEGGEGAFLKLAIKHLGTVELKLRLTPGQQDCKVLAQNGLHGPAMEVDEKDDKEKSPDPPLENKEDSREEPFPSDTGKGKRKKTLKIAKDEEAEEIERRRLEIGSDSVLDQCFFCLYGLNLRGGFEASNHDGLIEHQNTNRGDYKTKEQCAGVFQYILPYAKACTRARLMKLRKVLRAVHKQFPIPPSNILADRAVDGFLDDPDFEEEKLSEMVLSSKNMDDIVEFALKLQTAGPKVPEGQGQLEVDDGPTAQPNQAEMSKTAVSENGDTFGSGTTPLTTFISASSDVPGGQSTSSSQLDGYADHEEAYVEVYENLYHFVSEIEDISASEKWAGFVLTKEGEEFVEQNAKILKYDLCYNPMRFESWNKLAKIYDEEVDLMLNDGSKNVNAIEWRKNSHLTERVEMSRRRTRRCLLMTLALAKTPEQQSEVHELLALVYYDSLQNVAPSFDQRNYIPKKNASWLTICQKALKHFEGAFLHKPDWKHLFYMGKLCEKLQRPCEEAFRYYKQAMEMKSSAVDPIYRLHASRLKLLCESDEQDLKVLQVIGDHCYAPAVKEKVCNLLKRVMEGSFDQTSGGEESLSDGVGNGTTEDNGNASSGSVEALNQKDMVAEIRRQLLEDCVVVMKICVEGELKHFHKARFRLAHGLYSTRESQDLDRAKEELAFCFRSSRSLFTINMWEIDGSLRKIRRKAAHQTNLDVQMPESSRKFITCVRKYLILYLTLCEKTGDIYTLERAFSSLKIDKKFSLCLDDISRVALGKYIQALAIAICQADANCTMSNTTLYSLLEKLFNLFMDYGTSWSESLETSLAEAQVVSTPEVSEGSVHGYIHRYLTLLENETRLENLEAINEKIRKRFKSFKLLGYRTAQICRHACLAWCRALCYALSSITPLPQSKHPHQASFSGDHLGELVVDLQEEIFMSSSYELPASHECSRDDATTVPAGRMSRVVGVDVISETASLVSCMKAVPVRQATLENLEKATSLLRSTYVFYRDSLSGPFPGGINLFLVGSATLGEGSSNGAGTMHSKPLDISTPRKLLLWAFTLVHGRAGSVAEAVKYCEEQAKPRLKRAPTSSVLHTSPSAILVNTQG